MNKRYPLMLAALAASERMPTVAICDTFDMSRSQVLSDIVLFRDLLVSRAREQDFVHHGWSPTTTLAHQWLREISYAVAGSWVVLLSPREREELRHVRFVINHLKRRYASVEAKKG